MRESVKSYILYVGNDYPHKNLKRLESAFDKLAKNPDFNYGLVLSTKFIGAGELDELYKNASLFVFPSLYEGFGLPPLEAMKRGIPVASSNVSCMPEILGNAALYFNPLDINDMADKILKALSDDGLRKQLVQKGYEQIKKYNWRKMAEETLNIYKNFSQN